MTVEPAGYSGTPLAKKPGISAGSHVAARHAPGGYVQLLGPMPNRANRGTQVRPATLRDGTTVSIRGYDHVRYVLARTISIN